MNEKETSLLINPKEACDKINVNSPSLDLNTSTTIEQTDNEFIDENKTSIKTDISDSTNNKKNKKNKKKKNKKNKYKDLMSSIMAPKTDDEMRDKLYKKKIVNSTGGGQFKKGNLDKI